MNMLKQAHVLLWPLAFASGRIIAVHSRVLGDGDCGDGCGDGTGDGDWGTLNGNGSGGSISGAGPRINHPRHDTGMGRTGGTDGDGYGRAT
jgi:hypothetical protein